VKRIDTRTAPTAYIVAMAAWVYGFAQVGESLPTLVVFVLLLAAGAVQVAAGYLIGRWEALALGAAPVLIALAAGGTDSSLWLTVLLLMVFPGGPLLAAGVLFARWVAERHDPSPDGWLYGERPD